MLRASSFFRLIELEFTFRRASDNIGERKVRSGTFVSLRRKSPCTIAEEGCRNASALSVAAVLNARWNGFSSAGSFSIKLHLFLSLRNAPDASLISSYWRALLPLEFLIRIAVSILCVTFYPPARRFVVSSFRRFDFDRV